MPDFSPEEVTFNDDVLGGGSSNVINALDKAIHPDGKSLIMLAMKSRGEPDTRPQRNHILSRMIRRGILNDELGLSDGVRVGALGAYLISDETHSIGEKGMGRDEFLEGIASLPTMPRNNNGGGNGGAGRPLAK